MDAILAGFTVAFIDNIIVADKTQDERLKRLFSVFKRFQQYDFRVRAEKI